MPAKIFWTFAVSLLVSLFFSTVSYALRTMSRVQLEQALVRRRRSNALDSILSRRYDIALIASTLRLTANTTAMVAVAWYFLDIEGWGGGGGGASHPFRAFTWTVL